jgi:hypothetical protein
VEKGEIRHARADSEERRMSKFSSMKHFRKLNPLRC